MGQRDYLFEAIHLGLGRDLSSITRFFDCADPEFLSAGPRIVCDPCVMIRQVEPSILEDHEIFRSYE